MSRVQLLERRGLWALMFGVAALGVALGGFFLARRRLRDEQRAEVLSVDSMVDEALAQSFPASDPPPWSPVVSSYGRDQTVR